MALPPDDTDKRSLARVEALMKALESVRMRTPGLERTRQRGAPLEQRRFAEHDLVDEITSAAQRIAAARHSNGEPVYRTDGIWRVLSKALVTPRGRAELAAARTREAGWLATLLNGLGDHELRATRHVVRVIRQRLERDARELERHKAALARRNAEQARRNALLSE